MTHSGSIPHDVKVDIKTCISNEIEILLFNYFYIIINFFCREFLNTVYVFTTKSKNKINENKTAQLKRSETSFSLVLRLL